MALAPTPDASRSARLALERLGLPDEVAHPVTLLTSEIVANCVRHAHMAPEDRIRFCVRVTGEQARVEVTDTGRGFDPEVRHAAEGFGLRMLDQLASRWGTDRDDDGSCVWFEVDRRRGRFARS